MVVVLVIILGLQLAELQTQAVVEVEQTEITLVEAQAVLA
jgi:hypothetical protein